MNDRFTEAGADGLLAELDGAGIVSPVAGLNFRFAGAVIEVNSLIRKGWTDLSSYCAEGEFVWQGSTWIELAVSIGALEYHVSVALGKSLQKYEHPKYIWKAAYGNDAVAAHGMSVPRHARFRQLFVHVLDTESTKYEPVWGDMPGDLAARIADDLTAAVESPSMFLVQDLDYQTDGLQPFNGMTGANDAENKLLILKGILAKGDTASDKPSILRLLDPLARAVLTDDDPEGRAYAAGVASKEVIALLLESAAFADATEATVALFKMFIQNCREPDFSAWPFELWCVFASALLQHDLVKCGWFAVGRAIALRDAEDRSHDGFLGDIAWRLADSARRNVSDANVLKGLSQIARALSAKFKADDALKVFGPLLDYRAAELENRGTEEYLHELEEMLDGAIAQFDEEHKGDGHPWMKDLCLAVKAPAEFQAMLFAVCGMAGTAILAHPQLPLQSVAYLKRRPPRTVVEGMSHYDLWAGFLPENPSQEDYRKQVQGLDRILTKKTASEKVVPIEYTGAPVPDSVETVEEDKPASMLSALAVRGRYEDGGREEILRIFPFLPHGLARPGEVTVGAVWEYFPWERCEGADARIRLDNGDCLYATLPYYATDKWLLPRGARFTVRIAGFAHSLERSQPPENLPEKIVVDKGPMADEAGHPVEIFLDPAALDWFDQDVLPSYISRAGYSLRGRITKLETLKALGTDVLLATVDCRRLETPFDIFIPVEKAESGLRVGDLVESVGWVYADFRDPVDSIEAYKKENPKEPPQEPDSSRYGSGVPTFVRTEFTDEEKKWMPARTLNPDWSGYAESKLRSVRGVTKVVRCPQNPQRYSFLVRQNGALRKVAFLVEDGTERTKDPFVGTELLILRRTRQGNGFKLEWEFDERTAPAV